MFCSRNTNFRNPVGAVEEGTNIHFKILAPRNLRCSAARLYIETDRAQPVATLDLFWCGMSGQDSEWWECDYTPNEAGLYFYFFTVQTWHGECRLTRGMDGWGSLGGGAGSWQLTVYRKGFSTPDWLCGGVMYQIFPDRFCASGQPKGHIPQGRRIHTHWDEEPEWRPDAQGKVTNSDYFGGDLRGIAQKLDNLQELGVTCLYLNPVFEAHSNHRYDTACYERIDPLLGGEEEFAELCRQAQKRGISVILDGVFSHTGSDSVYFNRGVRYPGLGAFQSRESPYYSWYRFRHWPDQYECWWNFPTLPNVEETQPSYLDYIAGPQGIVQKWMRLGARGWRLDVADELPDVFLDTLYRRVKTEKPDAFVVGEVWEDASNKTAYGVRRRYLQGGQMDSVMNYPFREAILGFVTGRSPAETAEQIGSILEHYPPPVIHVLMNHIGTHDTERAVTVLAGEPLKARGREWQRSQSLSPEQWELGVRRLKLASLMQYTLPGVPCVYYGDEAGMEGYKDPFNRRPYPWGRERQELLRWYRWLGKLRRENPVFQKGDWYPLVADRDCLVYVRHGAGQMLLVGLNTAGETRHPAVPDEWRAAEALLGEAPKDTLEIPAYSGVVLRMEG